MRDDEADAASGAAAEGNTRGAHGFCHLRVTENRALALATRLGVTTTATPAATPRPRRKPPVEGMNPDSGTPAPQAE